MPPLRLGADWVVARRRSHLDLTEGNWIMALFSMKTDEQRAADAAKKAEAAYWASPQGKAAQAFARGDEFFQIEIPHSSVTGFTNAAFNSATQATIRRKLSRTDLLGQIEETGWHLLHADWVYIQTGQNSRDKFLASGQHVVVTGEVIGIYLFRRDEKWGNRAASPMTPEPRISDHDDLGR